VIEAEGGLALPRLWAIDGPVGHEQRRHFPSHRRIAPVPRWHSGMGPGPWWGRPGCWWVCGPATCTVIPRPACSVAEEDFLQGEHHAQCRNGNPRDRAAHDARRLCRTERGPTKGCGCVDGRVL